MIGRFLIVTVLIFAVRFFAAEQRIDDSTATKAPPLPSETNHWSSSISLYTYVVPEDHNYVQPTITADYGWLHLEARYNYESRDTGSAWLGYNFSGGDALAWEFTPMLGGVF